MKALGQNVPREAMLAAIIVVLLGLIGLRAPVFLSPGNLLGVLTDTSFLFMLALAQMAVILTRGIDLSVAANLALSGMIVTLADRAHPGLSLPVLFALAALSGLILGAFNGALIAFVEIPPIVVTLGTLSIYRGLIFVIAGGQWLTSNDMSRSFLAFPRDTLLGLPNLLVVALVVSVLFWLLLNHTSFGRNLYAIGGNPVAARYCGISLTRQIFAVYILSGVISGLCGLLWVSRYGIAYSGIAQGYELTVIAACVIGGVSIAGGIGSIVGALLGALFLGIIVNALPVMQVSPFWQVLVSGVIILLAVVLNARSEHRAGRLILKTPAREGTP